MKLARLTFLFFISACTSAIGEPASDESLITQAIGASLQGDGRAALAFLSEADPARLLPESEQFHNCMSERLSRPLATENPTQISGKFTRGIIHVFRKYWHRALTNPDQRATFTSKLDVELKRRLMLDDKASPSEIDEAIRARLRLEGNYALLGQTGVLRELMIWRKEVREQESVTMPHGTYKTSVAYLDEFIEPGWAQYATCEQRGSGGWVADRTLFAVVPVYDDIQSEEFRVTFLGHETQHFLDLDTYDNLTSWELEYRAKLIELSLAVQTLPNVLQKFIEDRRNDQAYPHSYANHRLVDKLVSYLELSTHTELNSVDHSRINKAAFALFKEDTEARR